MTRSLFTDDPRYRVRGSVLIGVLAVIFLSTVMLYRFVEEAVQELQYRGQLSEDPDLRATGYSGLEVALGVLHEFRTLDGKLVAPAQGWARPLEYADWSPPDGYEVEVTIVDESAKLPLDALDEELLPLFLEEMELDFRDSERLAESLLDWQDGDDLARLNGAEVDTYSLMQPPYRPSNKPLQSWDELRKIEGFQEVFFDELGRPNQLHEQFTSSISIHHSDKVNLNSANSLVLRFIGRIEGFDPDLLQDFLLGRDGISGTEDDQILFQDGASYYSPPEDNARSLGTTEATVLRLDVLCRRGDAELLLSALVDTVAAPTGGTDQHLPFNILRLSENMKIN